MAAAALLCACGTSGGHPAPRSPRPTAAPSTTTTAPKQPTGCTQAGVISSWSLRRQVAQIVVVPVSESDVGSALPLVRQGAGGLVLLGSVAPSDLAAQLSALDAQAPSGLAPIAMADEEGGAIQSVANLAGNLPWPRVMGQTMTPAQVQSLAAQVGAGMRRAGLGMDLAPVLGIDAGPGPSQRYPIGARSFGASPAVVEQYSMAFARGLEQAGVVPVVKHFPGLGRASYNTDFGTAYTPSLASLQGWDLKPFVHAINSGVPAVMVSDAIVPGLTRGPASLSSAAIKGLLRGQLGFKGLVVTDSLSAVAVSNTGLSLPQAAVKAVQAGVQMLLFTAPAGETSNQASEAVISALYKAVRSGAISETTLVSAVAAVLEVKGVNLCTLSPQRGATTR